MYNSKTDYNLHTEQITLNSEGFAVVTTTKQLGDIIDIIEYDNTNGSYVSQQATKKVRIPFKYEPNYI